MVGLESPMLHTLSSSLAFQPWEENFQRDFTIYGKVGHFCHVTRSYPQTSIIEARHIIWFQSAVSEEKLKYCT